MSTKANKQLKNSKAKIGDIVVTSNYRLGMKVKKDASNARMGVITPKGKDKGINPIVSVTKKNKGSFF